MWPYVSYNIRRSADILTRDFRFRNPNSLLSLGFTPNVFLTGNGVYSIMKPFGSCYRPTHENHHKYVHIRLVFELGKMGDTLSQKT